MYKHSIFIDKHNYMYFSIIKCMEKINRIIETDIFEYHDQGMKIESDISKFLFNVQILPSYQL